MRFDTDGKVVRARFIPRPEHGGFHGVTHGGLLTTLLDEIMVWAIAVQVRQFAFAAELNIRFVRPAKAEIPLTAMAELIANRRHRLFEAKSELSSEAGELLASATGKYLPVPREHLGRMRADLAGDWDSFQDILGPRP